MTGSDHERIQKTILQAAHGITASVYAAAATVILAVGPADWWSRWAVPLALFGVAFFHLWRAGRLEGSAREKESQP